MPFALSDFALIAPESFLTLAGLALLIFATVVSRSAERQLAAWAIASLAVTGLLLYVPASMVGSARSGFGGMFLVDGYSLYFKGLILAAGVVTILFSVRFVGDSPYPGGEYYSLIVFSTVGMLFMASGTHLISIYVALELMALSQYVLAGYFKRETKSIEAAAKYFILGAFSSGFLLYGFSLVYGVTGRLDLAGISAAISTSPKSPLLTIGIILVACGLFFKIASAPFHVWAPDVYEGAPTPISAFFAVGPKLAAWAILARIFISGFGPSAHDWTPVIVASAALTMVIGNVGALLQENVKRMLGYSSIGHAGYALLGLLGGGSKEFGLSSILVYLAAYAAMNLGAFGMVILLESKGYACEKVSDFNGLARKNPIAAIAMITFLLSLAGIPPTAGFVGKYLLFSAAMEAGWFWLALLGVLMSAVSLFYYFRIVKAMYFEEGAGELRWREEPAISVAIASCAVGTLAFGLFPQPLISLARACLLP